VLGLGSVVEAAYRHIGQQVDSADALIKPSSTPENYHGKHLYYLSPDPALALTINLNP